MSIKTVKASVIHYLHGGYAACEIKGIPREWPDGHFWVDIWFNVNSPKCLESSPVVGKPDA